MQTGGVLPGHLKGHEHFGFDDGVSQPGIRGRVSEAPNDVLTARHIAPGQFPAEDLYGYPGQDLVWPGEFVIGYPRASPDPLIPGPVERALPAWTTTAHSSSIEGWRRTYPVSGARCTMRPCGFHNCLAFRA